MLYDNLRASDVRVRAPLQAVIDLHAGELDEMICRVSWAEFLRISCSGNGLPGEPWRMPEVAEPHNAEVSVSRHDWLTACALSSRSTTNARCSNTKLLGTSASNRARALSLSSSPDFDHSRRSAANAQNSVAPQHECSLKTQQRHWRLAAPRQFQSTRVVFHYTDDVFLLWSLTRLFTWRQCHPCFNVFICC